jgi:hypothetical protein
LYGWEYRESADTGELCDYDAGSIRGVIGGRFKPCALLRDEPFEPLDLHEPDTWHDMHVPRHPLVFVNGHYISERLLIPVAERRVALDWSALYEPMHKVQRYEPLPDRYREISRVVTNIKTGKAETWSISRALDGARPQLKPEPDSIRTTWLQWGSQVKVLEPPHFIRRPPKLVTDGAIHVVKYVKPDGFPGYCSYPIADCCGAAPGSVTIRWEPIEQRLSESRWSGPMCNPTRQTPLPPSPSGPHRLIQPYSKRDWTPWPVKETELLLAKQSEAGMPLYFVKKVTPE